MKDIRPSDAQRRATFRVWRMTMIMMIEKIDDDESKKEQIDSGVVINDEVGFSQRPPKTAIILVAVVNVI